MLPATQVESTDLRIGSKTGRNIAAGMGTISRWQAFWRDFHAVEEWDYPDLAPRRQPSVAELGPESLPETELQRAEWFWAHRPSSLLGDGLLGYLIVVTIAVLLLVVPSGIGILLAIGWLVGIFFAISYDTVRLYRWRREYEVSLRRLFLSKKSSK